MSVLVLDVDKPTDCGRCFVGDRTICVKACPLFDVVRTGEGLYETYTPPNKEVAEHVTEVFRESSKRLGIIEENKE